MKATIEITDREMKMIRSLCTGRPAKQFYSEMGISRTRWMQLQRRLFDKLGVENRLELILWAAKKKIV